MGLIDQKSRLYIVDLYHTHRPRVKDIATLFLGCRYEKGTFIAHWDSTIGLVARKNKTVLGITEMPQDRLVRIRQPDMNSILSQILEANFNDSLSMSICLSSLKAF